jgi:B-cell receptor-associated protein 31
MFDLGWLIMFLFLLAESLLVLLLVMPMPSNQVRGAIITVIVDTWEKNNAVRYTGYFLGAINVIYFLMVFDALRQPFYAFGFMLEDALVSCEFRAMAFERERNAYITGFSLFLFLVLRRMVDIQRQLFKLRAEMKDAQKRYPQIFQQSSTVPMGQPVHEKYY